MLNTKKMRRKNDLSSQFLPRAIKYSPSPWLGGRKHCPVRADGIASRLPPGASRSIRGELGVREQG